MSWCSSPSPAATTATAGSKPATWPATGVRTVAFAGDLVPHQAALGAAMRGAVCVTGADFSQAELEAVRGRVDSEPDALRSVGLEVTSSYIDVFENRVVFGFLYADEAALRWVDDRYGGAVELQSFLKPA